MLQIPRSRLLSRFVLAAPLLLLVACQSTENPTMEVLRHDGHVLEVTTDAPTDDHGPEEHLAQYIRSTQVVDGCQQVNLDLKNRSQVSIAFAYQVEWLDRAGQVVVDEEAVWTPLVLEGGEQVPLELSAPHPRAESWRLKAVELKQDA